MRLLVISGSRNPEGRTAQCGNAIRRGFDKAGGTSEIVFLPTLELDRCRQCDMDGWGQCRDKCTCIIEDDFAAQVGKLKAADIAVFVSPVYVTDVSESMRVFLDRLRRISRFQNPMPMQDKPAVVLACAGVSGLGASTTSTILETMVFKRCGFDVVDVINVRRQNIDLKIPILETTGSWLFSKPISGPRPASMVPVDPLASRQEPN
jgi:multimeric flavodoxin WrbA